MKFVYAFLFLLITAALVYVLDTKAVLPAPLGRLLAPQQGIWQNAERADENFSDDFHFANLKGKTDVYFDDRLVPHIFAENEDDAYFVQGFLHAKFRLWQMELQAKAAAGRVSEIIGDKGLQHDRQFRRMGMVYAAENSLKEMEANPITKASCDAYTAGVNAFINSLTAATLPIEYKLIGYQPERWTNFKSALFLKYMSYDLAGYDEDFELTNAKNYFSPQDFAALFPAFQDSLDPIIPRGTVFPEPSIKVTPPQRADSVYFMPGVQDVNVAEKPDKANGSNNWAVSGTKTKSGKPILCNDPHLGLNLPSLWYEMQINTPAFNAYGVSFPGAPSVIIGFNDSCAFGFTNGGRDVKDYYEIKFKDESRKEYWFAGEWKQTDFRYERIKIAGRPDFVDTVAYTLFGPVMYDASFGSADSSKKNYALRWSAHDASNELIVFNRLNHAKNYTDYVAAVTNLSTPGQNCVFACKNGDIALRTQGNWPAKWKGQGDFVMPGIDSAYMWQGFIPQHEVPYQYNPERGFVSSANQRPVDTNYYYYLGRNYPSPRGFYLNKRLTEMANITPKDMMDLQNDNHNEFAAEMAPIFIKNIADSLLGGDEKRYFDLLKNWDFNCTANAQGATVYQVVYNNFYKAVYDDELAKAPKSTLPPMASTLKDKLLKDSSYKFVDNINTPERETLKTLATASFKASCKELMKLEAEGRLDWGAYKQTKLFHLAKIPEFSTEALPVEGADYALNANKMDDQKKQAHGPSWRMIVSLTEKTEAYGIYPGGQSGNPGSRFYNNSIADWVAGKYYQLWVMTLDDINDQRVIGKMSFSN